MASFLTKNINLSDIYICEYLINIKFAVFLVNGCDKHCRFSYQEVSSYHLLSLIKYQELLIQDATSPSF